MANKQILEQKSFAEVLEMIKVARAKAAKFVNYELIDLYWNIGAFISEKCKHANWGAGVVKNLSKFIHQTETDSKGFSSQNLWRMKQFYEIYHANEKLSPLVREIGWTNNMIIVSQAKSDEEKEFYLKRTAKENYTKNELLRQFESGLFERSKFSSKNISPVARETYPTINEHIRDYYSFEFLKLHEEFSEHHFQKAILQNLKTFILEFGKDFLFIGEEYRIQVGNRDFAIDLLFFHRDLNCLVAIELKVGEFKPEYMGKMDFYLGALDKDIRKAHENPSVGIIMCRTKDENIVEISLNRSTSPTVITQYETKLIPKNILKEKMNDLFLNKPDGSSKSDNG